MGAPSIPLEIKGGRLCGMGLQANTDGYGVVVLDLDGSVVGEQWVDADMANADERRFSPVSTNWLCSRKKRLPRKVMCLPVPVWHCRVSSPMICDCLARAISVGNVWISKQFDVVRRLDPVACNEANAAALAQVPGYATQRKDSGRIKPTDSFIYMSTDVGIGGAVIREGRVVSGDHGFGGELGHVSVDMRGPVCRCGRRGCLEVYAGRRSMVSAAGIASSDAAATRSAIDELIDRWHQRDAQTVAVVEKALEAMASVIASTINVCDVDVVMLGGLWARFEPELIRRIERMVRPQVLAYPGSRGKRACGGYRRSSRP